MKKVLLIIILISFITGCNKANNKLMEDLTNKDITYIKEYSNKNKLDLEINYEYNDTISRNLIISQSINLNTKLEDNMKLKVIISSGKLDKNKLKEDNINELGYIPVMMYHGIVNMKDNETKYTEGNVDKDGYNRTTESFRKDLEFYYKNDYRMIRLQDYIDGNIKTEYKKSPIVLTFDDGNENNLKVTGLDDKGNIIIDPNCAIGILEEFKKKYPDYNVTATFFLNAGLFNQTEYNEKILNWLVNNGYDIGNHTLSHVNFKNINKEITQKEVSGIYKLLDKYIPNRYVKIVALPFGSPYNKIHDNFQYIIEGIYDNYKYNTVGALRVGWEANHSCFDKNFDSTFIKRIRAWDNNSKEFDIEMAFNLIKNKKYISDGNINTIVTSNKNKDLINNNAKEVIIYE